MHVWKQSLTTSKRCVDEHLNFLGIEGYEPSAENGINMDGWVLSDGRNDAFP